MLEARARYIFAPDSVAKDRETAGRVYYGWTWNKVSVIVGWLPSETAHKRIEEISNLNLQLVGEGLPAVPPLTILETPSLTDPVWVTYRTPNLRAQRFYTIQPLQLDLVPKVGDTMSNATVSQLDAVINANPVRLRPPREDTPAMDMILNHINISPILDQMVRGTLKTSQLLVPVGLDPSPPPKASSPRWDKLTGIIKRMGMPLRFLAGLCNIRMPISYSGSTLAKDVSATMQQTDVRLEQVLNSKEQFDATRPENVQSIAYSTARYINFFNCVWLIVNDVIIGFALGGFICDNKD
ncbi:phosphatidylinositol N-acetylglucosaminyltransferase subunit gpi1, partial [Ceratobasidium sp. UAMH 11750]